MATALVNARGTKQGDKLGRFMDKHWDSLQERFEGDRTVATQFLADLAFVLRDAWDKGKWDPAEQNLERIFAAHPGISELRDLKLGESRIGPISKPRRFERPAFKVRLGHKIPRNNQPTPIFEPRDVLDEIAYAVLRAGSLGLLKICEGKSKGWSCTTPYVVADEGRRRFCYETCGDQAKAEAKKKPKKGRKG